MDKSAKIFVAGHRGLVGSALVNELKNAGYTNLVLKTHSELDLIDFAACEDFFAKENIDFVFLAAAKVGGIYANNAYRADFIYQNLCIQNNVIHLSYKYGVKKLLFLGSSCIYPKFAPNPIEESSLLTSELEWTNEPYAIAKIAGIKMCESYNIQYGTNFISVMPTNLYGQNDNFDLQNSHVLPALIRRFHEAKINGHKSVTLWGTGAAKREFLHASDMARASIFIMQKVDFKDLTKDITNGEFRNTHLNIGSGSDISIKELAHLVAQIVGFSGEILFDSSKPDGTPRKLLSSKKIKDLGFTPKISLKDGITQTYEWYKANAN
ncbi:MAG: GDP-L-fucose synthase [Helicobacter sp.]|nr:GDP-L-fucose synthase [Helicobacter sp.]